MHSSIGALRVSQDVTQQLIFTKTLIIRGRIQGIGVGKGCNWSCKNLVLLVEDQQERLESVLKESIYSNVALDMFKS